MPASTAPKDVVLVDLMMADKSKEEKDANRSEENSPSVSSSAHGLSPSVLEGASYLSILSFWFLTPLIKLGYNRPLEISDVPRLGVKDEGDALRPRFNAKLDALREKIKSEKPKITGRGIANVIRATLGKQSTYGGIALIVWVCSYLLQPMFVKAILVSMERSSSQRANITDDFHLDLDTDVPFAQMSNGALFALVAVVGLTQISALNHGFYHQFRFAWHLRMGLMNAVFEKASSLSMHGKLDPSFPNIQTLMAVDPTRMAGAAVPMHWLWLGPVLICVSIGLLASEIKTVALVPVGIMAVLTFLQLMIARRIAKARRQMVKFTDSRVQLTTEILHGIRLIKSFAWENHALKMVQEKRTEELRGLRKLLILMGTNMILFFLSPILISFCTFVAYDYFYDDLNVNLMITVLAYINLIRLPMAIMPRAVGALAEAVVSAKRLERFLCCADEVSPQSKRDQGAAKGVPIQIDGALFQYAPDGEGDAEQFQLSVPHLHVERGELIVVVGSVGAGKSTLLAALLGEMKQLEGACSVSGSVGYVAQKAWIQNQTARDNILFGAKYRRDHYTRVCAAAQLFSDFKQLPSGDMTEIGDRGLNISGGQKQRIAIARAIYKKRDLYLFDDPLSAVDVHVANAIFQQVICGRLKNSTRIVVLNSHYHLCTSADKIIVCNDGKVEVFDSHATALLRHKSLLTASFDISAAKGGESNRRGLSRSDSQSSLGSGTTMSKSVASVSAAKKKNEGKLYEKEDRKTGAVKLSTYVMWFQSASSWGRGIPLTILIFLSFAVGQTVRTIYDFTLADWTEQLTSETFVIFVVFAALTAITAAWRTLLFIFVGIRASRNFHNTIFAAVLSAPINLFFDTTPTGQIINRFTSDLDHVDLLLPEFSSQFFQNSLYVLAAVVVCILSYWAFSIALVPIGVFYYRTQQFFRRTSRELKRLEGTSRSPIFSAFEEMLAGVETIRASDRREAFLNDNIRRVDVNTSIYIHFHLASRWLALRLDIVGVAILCSVTGFALFLDHKEEDVKFIGLGLIYAIQITGLLQWTIRTFIETENNLTSVERLGHYANAIPVERKCEKGSDHGKDFLTEGSISVEDLCMRYRPELPLVVKGVSFQVRAKEKVGVCGRTGSGKSSLIVALFRIVEADSGCIKIDGTDISTLPLDTLRSKLSFIPQDPVLFTGTIRSNIDPFSLHNDSEIWEALRSVELGGLVKTLDAAVSAGGENFSAGERALLCMARAILRKSKIIVMDEATAAIDGETDQTLQKMIAAQFREMTVITIAHRLDTILDSDKILVLDAGEVVEFGPPADLLRIEGGAFKSLHEEMVAQES